MRNEQVQKIQELEEPLNPAQRQSQILTGQWLNYEAQPNVEGECLLTQVVPIRKSRLRFVIYIFLSVILVGTPALLAYWYPHLKKKWYYYQVSIENAEQFYVVNNDGQPTYPKRQQDWHSFRQGESKIVVYFINRYLKYIVQNGTVKAASLDFFPRLRKVCNQGTNGLTLQQARQLRRSYGLGSMILERKQIQDLFVTEIMRPLYIFIVLSCILWTYQQYFYYGLMIVFTAAAGIITNLIQTYRLNQKIFEMAYFQTQVNFLRNGIIKRGSSKYVVPGDIIFIKDPMKMPFDGILLHGTALSNQCSITGQSVPVVKKAQVLTKQSDIKHSYIYQGSILIQVNSKKKFKQNLSVFQKFREQYGLPIYVVRTNFITMKGQLIRIISFPTQKRNIFEKQSVKFLLFLFIVTVISYIVLVIKLAEHADPFDLFIKFLDLVTVTVPPGLPVSMTFGIIFALQKMKQKSIFCTSPNKTIVGGMTNLMCFDKTGTLTQDFMDFYALIPTLSAKDFLEQKQPKFGQSIIKQKQSSIESILKNSPHIKFALNNMAVNHTIIRLQGTGQNVGDPMQVKMFEFGQFQISDDPIQNPQIVQQYKSRRGSNGAIYHKFQFDSQLFRMSTIAVSSNTGPDYYIYTKGSPQQMISILNSSTIPKDYEKVLKKYTCQGYRVLAVAHKLIKQEELKSSRLNLESNLVFDGFQIFQNRLKSQTIGSLEELQNANIPCVMITGDNPLTASSIGFQCKIFDQNKKSYICHCEDNLYILEKFHQHQTDYFQQDQQIKCRTIQQILSFMQTKNAQLCLTGKSFNHLIENHFQTNSKQYRQLCKFIKVYARTKPNDKARIISVYQSFGKIVSMCGDGANDCGALKQADIGLSLSQAQASISAPFTSQVTNISSMVELLKQCRAGLATNYSLFNIMAIYSLVQYNTVIIVQFYYGFPGDFHYLYWDVCCNFCFFLTFGYTGTAKKLTKQAPNCSLFTVSNIAQLMISFFIQMTGQFLMIVGLTYLYADQIGYYPDITYEQFMDDDQNFVTDSFENNILFMFSNFIYIFTLLAFSISKPWRRQFYTNIPFIVLLLLALGLSSILIIVPESRPEFMELSRFDYQPLLLFILGVSWGVGLFIYVLQKSILEPFFNKRKLENAQKLDNIIQ